MKAKEGCRELEAEATQRRSSCTMHALDHDPHRRMSLKIQRPYCRAHLEVSMSVSLPMGRLAVARPTPSRAAMRTQELCPEPCENYSR